MVGKGRILQRVGDLAFHEASLIDSNGKTVASATATARVHPAGSSTRSGVTAIRPSERRDGMVEDRAELVV